MEEALINAKSLPSGGNKSCEEAAVGYGTEKEGHSITWVIRSHLSERGPFEQGAAGGRESKNCAGEEASRPREGQVAGPWSENDFSMFEKKQARWLGKFPFLHGLNLPVPPSVRHSTCCVPGTILSALGTLSHLMCKTTIWRHIVFIPVLQIRKQACRASVTCPKYQS